MTLSLALAASIVSGANSIQSKSALFRRPHMPESSAAKTSSGIFDSEAGREAMADFEKQMWEFALQESELGKQARQALRLRSDKPRSKETRRAIKPFMAAYIKLLMAPPEKLERDEHGAFFSPVVL